MPMPLEMLAEHISRSLLAAAEPSPTDLALLIFPLTSVLSAPLAAASCSPLLSPPVCQEWWQWRKQEINQQTPPRPCSWGSEGSQGLAQLCEREFGTWA